MGSACSHSWRTDPPPLSLNASGSKSSEPTRGAISTLLEDLYTKPQTCCRCESVHAAVSAVAENPLELRRLLLSWPKERDMDSLILVNEAREAEFQMSKLDFINQ